MAATKGVNAYVSVNEAEAYFTDRLDADGWTSATPVKKGQAIVTATQMLDELNWAGTVVDYAQTLAFPRVAEYFDPRVGATVSLGAEVPTRIINATYEQALHLLNNANLLDDTGSVLGLAVSGINLTSMRPASKFSNSAMQLVRPLLVNSGASSWWRAN